jgi:single-strand DNA-binding protein
MNGIPITIIGNVTADPELRFTQNGLPVANFTIAHTKRTFDRAANEWKDGEPVFLRTSAWRELGEHVASSVVKGQRVIATGELVQRKYIDSNTQQERTVTELELDEIGPSLKYGTTVFTKSAPKGQAAQAPAQMAPQGVAQPVTAPQAPDQGYQQPPAQPGYAPQQPAQGYQAPAQPAYQAPGVPQAPAQPTYANAAVAGAQAAGDDVF